MKVNSLNSLSSVSNAKKQSVKQNVKPSFASTNAILNNSLSEAIGRSQVSFKGTAKNSQNKFEYTQKNLSGSSEGFTYDKATGVMEYTEKYANGQVKKFVRVIPKAQEEHVKEVQKDGSYTLESKTPDKTTFQEFDSRNNIQYSEKEYPSGRKVTDVYDYKNQRIINRVFVDSDQDPVVRVLDLNSKQDVPSYDTRLIQKDEVILENGNTEYREFNLVTGEIYRSEIKNGGTLIKGYTHSFTTGELTWNAVRRDSKLYEDFYNSDGELRKETITDFAQNSQVVQDYLSDGTKLPKVKKFFDKNGEVRKIAQYDLETDRVQYVTTYAKDLRVVDTYEPMSNVRLTTEAYRGEELVELIEYYSDGKTPKTQTEYSSTGFDDAPYCRKKVGYCDKHGKLECKDFFNADDIRYETHFYPKNSKRPDVIRKYGVVNGKYVDFHYTNNNKLEARIKYNSKNEVLSEIEYRYDSNIRETAKVYNKDRSYVITRYSETGLPVECNSYSKHDEILESIRFYADGKSPKDYVGYDNDGSYRYVKFDRDGNVLEDYYCNPDGSPRATKAKIFGFGSKDEVNEESIDDIIKNIMTIVGSANRSINDIPMTQWVKFIEYIGLDDVNQLFDIDTKTYRKLAKIYHPDLKINPSHEIMQILNYFYQK